MVLRCKRYRLQTTKTHKQSRFSRFYLSSKHVVVDEELTAKLSMADTKFSFQEVGKAYSPAWMSPEALTRAPEDLNIRAADMWSFAVLLWELNTREVPFADLSPMECGMKVSALQ